MVAPSGAIFFLTPFNGTHTTSNRNILVWYNHKERSFLNGRRVPMRKLPVGIQDFWYLREQDFAYVVKLLFFFK